MSEITEAAARLRADDYEYEMTTVMFSPRKQEDLCRVSSAYLAKHPPDDEPITGN